MKGAFTQQQGNYKGNHKGKPRHKLGGFKDHKSGGFCKPKQ
jgi:hypothetical protein